jgi:hypothetical protein
METTAPETVVHVSNLSKDPTRRSAAKKYPDRYLTGIFYYAAFIELLGALILAIIAVVKDELTKMAIKLGNVTFVEYCGWEDLHSYHSTSEGAIGPISFKYSNGCDDYGGKLCDLETIGTVWFSLLIIGIGFGGISLIIFILDFYSVMAARLLIIACNLIFFGCMLADALIWGSKKPCHVGCNGLKFPFLAQSDVDCNPKWGSSWILVIIAGGLAMLSIISMLMARSAKKY